MNRRNKILARLKCAIHYATNKRLGICADCTAEATHGVRCFTHARANAARDAKRRAVRA